MSEELTSAIPAQSLRGREDGRPIRIALVGAGLIAEAGHMPAIQSLGAAEAFVETIVELDAERGAAFAERWSVPHSTTELDEALMIGADLVILCTPPSVHRAQVAACLAAGVSVWCEKPPALSLADYDAMIAGEREGGPYASIVFQQRYGSGSTHAKSLLASGALGRTLAAHCQTTWYRGADYFDAPWRGSFSGDGGPILALGVHQLDLLLHLVGDWKDVSAQIARLAREIETDDVAAAWVRFENGALATVLNSAVSPAQESRIRIDTERATIELAHLHAQGNDAWRYSAPPGVEADPAWKNSLPDEGSTHAPQLREVIADLRAGRRPSTGGASARAALELVTALYKSALTGRTVTRGEIVAGDPFYSSLHGGVPIEWGER